MKTTSIREITFDGEETIMAATLSTRNEAILLTSSGNVIRFNLDNQQKEQLFSVKNNVSYPDGGFDITAQTSIYTLDNIVVVANDFKTHAFVHYPGKYTYLHLWRDEYHTDISTYPIALYKNKDGVPHLIFGQAWNHVQVMNLDTRQILTAAKSLIEENAEENHIAFYKKHEESNKLAWPRTYDYFFGKLFISPDQHHFLSAGWAWGSCDSYKVFTIEKFITSNRISAIDIGAWEHENRATCWVDNQTIAVAYNPFTEGEENSTADSPWEIHLYKIIGERVEIDRKIQLPAKCIPSSKIYFNKKRNSFITISDKDGLTIISLDGQLVFNDETLKGTEYNAQTELLFNTNEQGIVIYEMAE